MRNISCSHTKEQVRNRTKTVTRRLGWQLLMPGQTLRVVEKSMGLKPGEKIVPMAIVRVLGSHSERLDKLLDPKLRKWALEECRKEGFPDWTPEQFVEFFCREMKCAPSQKLTRIEWFYESRCLSCGFKIATDSSYCGECLCEEEGC